MEFLLFENYIERIESSLGTNMFRKTFFLNDAGEIEDDTRNGDLSCAIYVSSILKLFDLISTPHVNVSTTVDDMVGSGWIESNELRKGAVVVWGMKQQKSGPHRHIGFCIDEQTAISNDGEKTLVPHKHSIDYNGTRPIEKILWQPKLSQK